MPSKFFRQRKSAYLAQLGRCYYCGLPMWENDVESFSRAHKIEPPQAQPLQCTAEHLEAQQDGGKNTVQNIVAACLYCNRERHRIKPSPQPGAYRQLVEQRLSSGLWHREDLMRALKALVTCRDSESQVMP